MDAYKVTIETDREGKYVVIERAPLEVVAASLNELTKFTHTLSGLASLKVERV